MNLKEIIEAFLNGSETELKGFLSIGELEEILKSLGYEWDGVIDTNSWDLDFWVTFTHPDKIGLCYSGSLYWGSASLTKR